MLIRRRQFLLWGPLKLGLDSGWRVNGSETSSGEEKLVLSNGGEEGVGWGGEVGGKGAGEHERFYTLNKSSPGLGI